MPETERRLISQPPDWWLAFQEAAAKAGLPLSTWMGEVCKAALPKKVQKSLSERKQVGRPKEGK